MATAGVTHFSLADCAPDVRDAMLHDVIGLALSNIQIDPLSDTRQFDFSLLQVNGVALSAGSYSPHRMVGGIDSHRRDDEFILTWGWSTGPAVITQSGREVTGGSGQATFVTSCEPLLSIAPSGFNPRAIKVSRDAMTAVLKDPDRYLMKEIGPDNRAFNLLRSYADMVMAGGPVADPRLATSLSYHLCELIALALTDRGDGNPERVSTELAMPAIKRLIRRRLADPGLSIGLVAAAFGRSVRSIQLAFKGEGASFTSFVLSERLERARTLLVADDTPVALVSAIAWRCGFVDLAHFNRSFRVRYGMTPSEIRRNNREISLQS